MFWSHPKWLRRQLHVLVGAQLLLIYNPLLKMKPLATSLLLVLGIPAFLQAEDPSPSATGTYAPGTLEVPAFTPPLPVVPKEPLPDAETTIVCRDEKGETVTLQRGDASLAPDLPAPEPPPDPALVQRIEDHRPRNLMINMSATVYNHKVTAVNWQHPVTREPYEAILGFDLSLVAHLGSFVYEGKPCHSNIFCMHMDTESPVARRAAARRLPPVPVPSVEADGYGRRKIINRFYNNPQLSLSSKSLCRNHSRFFLVIIFSSQEIINKLSKP